MLLYPLVISAHHQVIRKDAHELSSNATSSPTQPAGMPPPLPMYRDEARAHGAVSERQFPLVTAPPTPLVPAYPAPNLDPAHPFRGFPGGPGGMVAGRQGTGALGDLQGPGGTGVGVWSGGELRQIRPRLCGVLTCC